MATQHGILTTVSGDMGLLQSVSATNNSDESVLQDELGNAAEQTFFNGSKEISVEVAWKTGVDLPAVGDVVTLTGTHAGKYTILPGLSDSEANTDYRKVSFTGRWFTENDLPEQS